MKLDFLTLYIVIMLNALSFAIVWGIIAWAYGTMLAARYWLSALVTILAGGLLLMSGDDSVFLFPLGQALIAGGFALMWQGIRVFYGRRPLIAMVAVIFVAVLLPATIFGGNRPMVNIIAAGGQIVAVGLAIGALVKAPQNYIGTLVAVAAAGILILGQGAEAIANTLLLTGHLTRSEYLSVAGWFLICGIIGGSIWNLGLLVMSVDQLRSELRALAKRDDLTGLPNRRGLRAKIILCEKSVRRKQSAAVLMMIDLDRFKAVNDRYGHAAGDAALVHLAGVAGAVLRDDDVLARVGGDEFCVLLPHTNRETASAIASRLGDAIAAHPLSWKGERIALSASIGLNEWRPEMAFGLADSLLYADAELLDKKRRGRQGIGVTEAAFAIAS